MIEFLFKHTAPGARFRYTAYATLAVVTLALCATDPRARTPPVPAASGSSLPMGQFVLLFRQSSPLSEAEQKRRAEEVRAWAPQQNAEGHKLDPRTLGEGKHRIGPGSQTAEAPLTGILFVEARDFVEAVKIAESHPGLRYGEICVEVRAWSSPLPEPPARPWF
jgi:hypothetical protein